MLMVGKTVIMFYKMSKILKNIYIIHRKDYFHLMCRQPEMNHLHC